MTLPQNRAAQAGSVSTLKRYHPQKRVQETYQAPKNRNRQNYQNTLQTLVTLNPKPLTPHYKKTHVKTLRSFVLYATARLLGESYARLSAAREPYYKRGFRA